MSSVASTGALRKIAPAGAAAILTLSTCSQKREGAAPPATSPAASSDASASSPVSQPISFRALAWTDAAAIDALTRDCRAAPEAASLLTCDLAPREGAQPCIGDKNRCLAKCSAMCDECATGCVESCATCRSRCADAPSDDCHRACAVDAGKCRNNCLERRMDACADSAECKQASQCEVDEARKWKRASCMTKCGAIRDCHWKCVQAADDPSQCDEKCQKRWPECPIGYCIMGPEPGAAP